MVFITPMRLVLRRIPLIRFRKGGFGRDGSQADATDEFLASADPSAASVAGAQPVLEDWELPRRFWRKPMDQTEMDYINRGGPA